MKDQQTPTQGRPTWLTKPYRPGAAAAHGLIRAYQLTLSGLIGRQCRHWPSCSSYTDEAIGRYGLWTGGWIGLARICRCNPLGTSGIDLVPTTLPPESAWYRPWRYGRWRGVNAPGPIQCEAVEPGDGAAPPRT
ncbi:membrane protein insertion efficiency factor YidD [Alsobacter soli]|uniref:Putative membrane protein insertion efficiency factor n=1 Tax=Alsobacter soli TaxID=2109933 RepID=A0A2T1HRX2_9HYPH|nr:membrane protein insertion efficiency factor YidD [Alsobacter soli]PSC04400.1 membrane protein insertion efficiency factor YidD [Alsobacter soli]